MLETILDAYIKCALWSSTDDRDEPLDRNHSRDDLAVETLNQMRSDCEDFTRANETDLAGLDSQQIGHDFWLTRNGHGAGFWDRGLGEVGERLSDASKVYGSINLYVSDDGLIYQ